MRGIKINKNKLVIFVFYLYLLLLIYLLFNPLYFGFFRLISPKRIPDMAYARDYYAVLSSVSGIILGSLGIILGYFYYNNQRKTNLSIQKREKQCRRLEAFINKLDKYDEYVHRVLTITAKDQKDLDLLRTLIVANFESIQGMLEQGYELLGITKDDTRAILKVNSFVDNNETITRCSYQKLLKSELSSIRSQYIELMRDARIACYKSII